MCSQVTVMLIHIFIYTISIKLTENEKSDSLNLFYKNLEKKDP